MTHKLPEVDFYVIIPPLVFFNAKGFCIIMRCCHQETTKTVFQLRFTLDCKSFFYQGLLIDLLHCFFCFFLHKQFRLSMS